MNHGTFTGYVKATAVPLDAADLAQLPPELARHGGTSIVVEFTGQHDPRGVGSACGAILVAFTERVVRHMREGGSLVPEDEISKETMRLLLEGVTLGIATALKMGGGKIQ